MSRSLFIGLALAAILSQARTTTAAPLSYRFAGQITEVTENQGNVIPNLAVGDVFNGYVTFESTGWHRSVGTVFASFNGVDLLFTGSYIFGNVTLGPANRYAIRVAADTGGSITGSTFNAGNFGPNLVDANGSAGYTDPFPPALDLTHFETNVFLISGTHIPSAQRISARGELTQFVAIPEPGGFTLIAAVALALMPARRRS